MYFQFLKNTVSHTNTAFWQLSVSYLLKETGSATTGLTEKDAAEKIKSKQKSSSIRSSFINNLLLLVSQYKNPLVLLLVFAVILSFFLREYADSLIVLTVLLLTGILGFLQERNAGRAMEKLRALVHSKAMVRREGKEYEIPIEEVVSGDIVLLNAGDIIPADALILESKDLHVNEAALTGESFPVEKMAGECKADLISKVTNAVFKGSSVINGTAVVLAVHTGKQSELGQIEVSLGKLPPLTAFEKGIRNFGLLLMRLTVIIAGCILIINLLSHKPLVDSVLFALALAVGLAPELLPAIVTITLSAGARRMAARKVIVKKLSAIQNLGEMEILCTDKTGTITEGTVKLKEVRDFEGRASNKAAHYAFLNASFETGFSNPIDEAIRNDGSQSTQGYLKKDEVPYDFIRKRLSVVLRKDNDLIMISKGALDNIVDVCSTAENAVGEMRPLDQVRTAISEEYQRLSANGFRVLGLSYKLLQTGPLINMHDEKDMVFLGFIVLFDPPKEDIVQSIQKLAGKGIDLKIITGDNQWVARHLAGLIGLSPDSIMTGDELYLMTDDALVIKAKEIAVFAEIVPAQKARIIKALQKSGAAVGYLGDGINDANALQAADVGISIDNAVDVAKEAADLVLLDRDINVIRHGVEEGRRTFSNTLKYITATISANFGNMFSMALASLILPFLPLLPVQILLNNFLSDLPAIAIASDNVDEEMLQKPRRWDMRYIGRFMVVFGLLSSLFDFATFALLIFVYKAAPEEFRTAWFIESLLTEILVLLVIRTGRPFFQSRPSKYLVMASLTTFLISTTIPYLPFAYLFSFSPLPFRLYLYLLLIIMTYVLLAEISKRYLIKSGHIKSANR